MARMKGSGHVGEPRAIALGQASFDMQHLGRSSSRNSTHQSDSIWWFQLDCVRSARLVVMFDLSPTSVPESKQTRSSITPHTSAPNPLSTSTSSRTSFRSPIVISFLVLCICNWQHSDCLTSRTLLLFPNAPLFWHFSGCSQETRHTPANTSGPRSRVDQTSETRLGQLL